MYLVNHPTNGVFPSKRDIPRLVGSEVSEKSLIALIDDDLSVLTSLKLLLELEGHQVIASTNINDLMILIQSYESIPSLIVADYRLEESENGINAVTKIRNYANQHIPALVITGGVSSALEKLAHLNGCHLMPKSVSPDSFLELVSALIDGNANSPLTLQVKTPDTVVSKH